MTKGKSSAPGVAEPAVNDARELRNDAVSAVVHAPARMFALWSKSVGEVVASCEAAPAGQQVFALHSLSAPPDLAERKALHDAGALLFAVPDPMISANEHELRSFVDQLIAEAGVPGERVEIAPNADEEVMRLRSSSRRLSDAERSTLRGLIAGDDLTDDGVR
jgi:hypothetical protein